MQSATPEASRLLSVREAARLLGVCRRTLERRVAEKLLAPPLKIGARSLFLLADLQGYVAKLPRRAEPRRMICSVFKRKRRIGGELVESRHWFGALRMNWEKGSPYRWCLGTPDKREAERLLHAARVTAEKRHHGLLPPESQTVATETPLADLLKAFLADRRSDGKREGTVAKYANMQVLFNRCRWQWVRDVTESSFKAWRKGSTLKGKTLNDLLKNTRRFFAWMRRERMVSENPLELTKPVTVTETRHRRALTTAQAQRLLSTSPRHRAVIYLLILQHGLRRGEVASLWVGDVVFDAPAPFVRVRASNAKNRKEATLFLRPEVVTALREFIPVEAKPSAKVFVTVPRISTVRRDLERAGIPFVDEQGARVDLHALRVTLGSNLFASGASIVVVKELMRHRDIKTTLRHYCDVSQLPLAAAVANLPPLTIPGTGNHLEHPPHSQEL